MALVSDNEREIFDRTKKADLLTMYENRQEKVGLHTFRLCECLNISIMKTYTTAHYYNKKITDRVAKNYNDTWAAAAKNYIDHALEPKLYVKGRGRREVFGRDYNPRVMEFRYYRVRYEKTPRRVSTGTWI